MKQRTLDEMISYFDQQVLKMDIKHEDKIKLLGMITAIGYKVQKHEWIPCSERLPEPRIDVWVCSDLGQMVAYYEENVETWYGRNYLELLVTAWMPLPEPYKIEK